LKAEFYQQKRCGDAGHGQGNQDAPHNRQHAGAADTGGTVDITRNAAKV